MKARDGRKSSGKAGHYTASDLPLLRAARESYRRVLAAAESILEEPDLSPGERLSLTASVIPTIRGWIASNRAALDLLERTAPGWHP